MTSDTTRSHSHSHDDGADRFRKAFLLLLLAGISILFIAMVRHFVLAVFLAAIFAGLTFKFRSWVVRRLGGRVATASALTVLIFFLGVVLPLAGFLTAVTAEAIQIGQSAQSWFATHENVVQEARDFVGRIPLVDRAIPDAQELAAYVEEASGRIGSLMWGAAAAATRGTVTFLLQLFVFLYALFFFYLRGPQFLDQVMSYIPLSPVEKGKLLERFTSVARATLRGSLLIGIIQGAASGVGFWIAGVPGAALWGTVIILLAIIPALGAGLVWVPAVVYLFLAGKALAAILLTVWCVAVVGSIDNVLRPSLIGKDARMSDLMILLSTLGGIALFGALGFVVGPIVAALFVTVWQIYGEAFDDWLPDGATVILPPKASSETGDAIAEEEGSS